MVLVVRILNRYGAAYPTLIPRTMRTLLHALLDPSKVSPRILLLLLLGLDFVLIRCSGASSCLCSRPHTLIAAAAVLHALWSAERDFHIVAALDRHAAAPAHAAVR